MINEKSLSYLEDLLYANGVPSFCYLDKIQQSEVADTFYQCRIQIVLPSDKYIPSVNKILKNNQQDVTSWFGFEHQIAPQFLVYYISYLYIGSYAKNGTGFFVSTVFENIKTAQPQKRNGTSILLLNLRITIIKEEETSKTRESVKDDILQLLRKFNDKSRYIKFEDIKFGQARSRTDFEVNYENVKL